MSITTRRALVDALESRRLFNGYASTSAPHTSNTIYVSSGEDIKTIADAVNNSGDNTTILFHRGETFTTSGATETNDNIIIGAYGSGADPVLMGSNSSAATSSILSIKGSNVRIEDLDFKDNDGSTSFTAVSNLGTNVTIDHCNAQSSLYTFVYASKDSEGTTVSYCNAMNGQNAYFVYTAAGSKYLDVNNCYTTGSKTEHGIRTHTDHFRITFNRIIQPPASKYSYKSCLCIREGSDGYIGYNYLTGGQVTILGPLASSTSATLKDVTYEYNYCDQASQFQLFAGASNITIRNNSILKVGGTGTVITIEESDVSRSAPSGWIMNNYTEGDKLTAGNSSNLYFNNNWVV